MAIELYAVQRKFDVEFCCNCGCPMVIPSDIVRNLRETKKTFYCYNGHAQSYTESTADRFAKENEYLRQKLNDRLNEVVRLKERLEEINKPKRRASRTV